MNDLEFRELVTEKDVEAFTALVRNTGVFNEDEVMIAEELLEDGCEHGMDSYYKFILAFDKAGIPVGYLCYAFISGTSGTYEIYWVASDPSRQRQGIARRLMRMVEQKAKAEGGKRIFVQTSSKESYLPARSLYISEGYAKLAVVEEYYDKGDDLVILGKRFEIPYKGL